MGNVERIVESPTAVGGDQRGVGGAATAASRPSELGRSGVGLHWREFLILLFVADAVVVLVAILAAVRAWDALFPSFVPTPFFGVWIGATWALWLLGLRVGGAYDLLSPDVSRGHGGSLVRALSIVAVATIAAYFFLPFTFPRSTAIATPLPVLAGLVLWRWLMLRYLMNWSALHRRLLLLGLDETTRQLAMLLLRDSRHVPYLPVAFVTDSETAPDELAGIPIVRGTEGLWAHVRNFRAGEIAVARWEGLAKGSQQELVECFYAGVAASDAAKLYEELSGRVLIGQVGPDWYADLPTLPRRPYFGIKRLVDVVGGTLLLLVCVPLMLLLALLVLIDDGRPVLYRQVRLGRRGEPFVVRKFRTMRRDAEPEGPQYAQRLDPRTTRAGTFFRQSGLDELPQLWDVVRGKMSLIGPRPERPEFVDQLAAEMPLYRARLLVRPGIVGWAEVHIRHSATLKEHLARLEYDLYYIKHAGLLLDANIALRAIGVVLSGR